MWTVKLFNNYVNPCCGDSTHKELLATWEFDNVTTAWEFYQANVNKYGDMRSLGQWLEVPQLANGN